MVALPSYTSSRESLDDSVRKRTPNIDGKTLAPHRCRTMANTLDKYSGTVAVPGFRCVSW